MDLHVSEARLCSNGRWEVKIYDRQPRYKRGGKMLSARGKNVPLVRVYGWREAGTLLLARRVCGFLMEIENGDTAER